jgi:hypothetical protein
MQKIPERPEENDPAGQPEWKCQIAEDTRLDLRSVPQVCQWNVTSHHPGGKDQKQQRLKCSYFASLK